MKIKVFCILGLVIFLFPVFAQESDDEPYLSIEDQEALLDKAADEIMETTATAEHKNDSLPKQPNTERPYIA